MRQCRIMVAGFKATGEQDIRYMDGFMDGLLDFMDQGSDTEQLYRDYLAYISSFNPDEGKSRFLDFFPNMIQVWKEEHEGAEINYVVNDTHDDTSNGTHGRFRGEELDEWIAY
ncbi:MAG: hypothetical protein ACI37N_02355, partial [Prevotella sp.]